MLQIVEPFLGDMKFEIFRINVLFSKDTKERYAPKYFHGHETLLGCSAVPKSQYRA